MPGESRSVVVRLSMETSQAIRGAKDFGRQVSESVRGVERQAMKADQAIDHLGGTAGKVGLLAGAAFLGAATKAANFDEAMSHVAATGEDARGSLEALRKEALEAGARTKFSATEAAQGIEALAKAGVSAKDTLAGGLNGALDLAAAGQLSVADAAEITATALTQFQLKGDQATHVADLLAAGAGKAQGEVSDMALALKYAGVPAANLGVSIEQTAGTIALFAKNGILGEQAGTSLRGMLASLTSPSDIAADEMSKLGISVFDAQGNFVGLDGVAGQLQGRLKNLTQEERSNALGRIFGNEQLQAANVLYREGAEGVRKWTGEVDDAGFASETASRKMDNLKGDLEQLGGALETALIGAGSGSQGPLRELTQGATDVVNAFNSMPGPVQNSVTALLGLTAVVGGGAWLGAKTVQGISDTRSALEALGIDAQRTGRIMRTALNVTAVVGGLAILDETLEAIFDKKFDGSNLDRSIEALANGRIAGEILDKYGKDLKGFGEEAELATSKVTGLNRTVSEIPLVGGLLSGNFLPGKSTDAAVENIDQLDEKLASLVETGKQGAAAEIFEHLAAAAEDAGVSTKDLNGLFDAYGLALKNVESNADDAADAQGGLADATGETSSAAKIAVQLSEDQAKALREQREAARQTAESFVNLGDSLNDSKVSLNGWISELAKQRQALIDFQRNAQTAAKRGLDQGLIASLQEAGEEGALRMQQLAGATKAQLGEANAAWRGGQRAIRDYVNTKVPTKKPKFDTKPATAAARALEDKLRRLDKLQVNPKVNVETSQAQQRIAEIRSLLAGLRDKTVSVYVARQNLGAVAGVTGVGGVPQADGGTVRRAEMGATVPDDGRGYYDRYPYLLAPGEEIISNRYGQADKNRAELKAANRGAKLAVVGYADGGTIPGLASGGTARGGRIESDGIHELSKAAREAAKEMREAAKAERERVRDLKRTLASNVGDKFRSNPFENDNPWGAGGDWRSQLRQDISSARNFAQDSRRLKRKGVTGGALDYLLTNADPSMVHSFAGMSKDQLAQYSRLYRARERAANTAGRTAGNAAYGAQLAGIEKRIARLNQLLATNPQKTGEAVGKAVNGAASNGARRGSR